MQYVNNILIVLSTCLCLHAALSSSEPFSRILGAFIPNFEQRWWSKAEVDIVPNDQNAKEEEVKSSTNNEYTKWERPESNSDAAPSTNEDSQWGADSEVIYLPALVTREAQISMDRDSEDVAIDYNFDAFGRNFELKLVPNRLLVAPQFGVWHAGRDASTPDPELSAVDTGCHFIHRGRDAVAALSACRQHSLQGLILVDNSTYELRPLNDQGVQDRGFDGNSELKWDPKNAEKLPHVIRKAPPLPQIADDARDLRNLRRISRYNRKPTYHKAKRYTIEVALFLDEAAYKHFYPYFNYNEVELRDMLLAYINGVQALYHHPSLGVRVDISLVRMTLMRSQPAKLPTYGGERNRLLEAFCSYQNALNVEDDTNPAHWDMALLISGLDFYAEEGGRRSGVTMGLAPVGGVCLMPHSCVIAELGATDVFQRPYPSAGFTSVYILAHEIGHNLGMHHDSTGNTCARDGYIMSPSRGTSGEAVWSPCSAQVATELGSYPCLRDRPQPVKPDMDHNRFDNAPGAVWTAKKQCEFLLRDRDSEPSPFNQDICHQLQCRTPHRPGFYYAGPALPGTVCGQNKWCQGGECVQGSPGITQINPVNPSSDIGSPTASTDDTTSADGWSFWSEGPCHSGCIFKSKGHKERRRNCKLPEGCKGSGYDVTLCDDTKVCGKKSRSSSGDVASRRCAEFAKLLPELDPRAGGLQAPHDPMRLWMGCAIFCRNAAGGGYYAPRSELNKAGADPYFPDGTWCHHDGDQNFYCQQHHCLPENFKMPVAWHIWELPGEDLNGPMNARARSADDEKDTLRAYFSLDDKGMPLLRRIPHDILEPEPEEQWEVKDYVELKDFGYAA